MSVVCMHAVLTAFFIVSVGHRLSQRLGSERCASVLLTRLTHVMRLQPELTIEAVDKDTYVVVLSRFIRIELSCILF